MRLSSALPLVVLTSAALPAFADATYTFSLTDLSSGSGPITFSLDPSTAQTAPTSPFYEFANVSALDAGTALSLVLDITPTGSTDIVQLHDSDFNFNIGAEFSPAFASGAAEEGLPISFVSVTSNGFQEANCDTKVRSPFVQSELPVTLAFFQVQSPIVVECGDQLSLTVSHVGTVPPPPVSGVTPEPSSLALLGTGVLGISGVLRRRWER